MSRTAQVSATKQKTKAKAKAKARPSKGGENRQNRHKSNMKMKKTKSNRKPSKSPRSTAKGKGEPDTGADHQSSDGSLFPDTSAAGASSAERSAPKDLKTRLTESIEKLSSDAGSTKQEIRRVFLEFRQKLSEREAKLVRDVDATLDKKSRLLQTQLEYVTESNDTSSSELACDPNLSLEINRKHILTTLMTAGWIQGASSDNKEEQALQEQERKRRDYLNQQFMTVERMKQVFVHEKQCKAKREETMQLSSEIEDEIAQINARTAQVEAELAVARPLLEEANQAVSGIEKRHLDEIRALRNPPAVVELVMTAVAVLLGSKTKTWRDIQKCVLQPKFIQSVLNFDTLALQRKTRELCLKYVRHKNFNEERANKASKVAGPLVKWVRSQMKYSELLDNVRPMQNEIKALKTTLSQKQHQLELCVQHVQQFELKIGNARTEIDQMVENMIRFQDDCGLDGILA